MNNFEFLIPIGFFFMIVMIVKIITENRTRQKLIDKGIVDEKAKNLFTSAIQDNPLQSLKWGLVLVGIGVAMALSQIFPTLADAALMGLMFVFAGTAFLVYYMMAKKQRAE